MSELYTIGSVCSGMEAASVALNPLGFETVWLSEIEPAPCSVLVHHHPNVPNLGDMRKIAALVRDCFAPAPDILCGGTPCQAFSIAGLRDSLDDERGNLTLVFCEIADEIDNRRAADGLLPCVVLWENVPGVLNTEDNAFGCFLAGLAGEDDPLQPPGKKWENAGCVYGPKRAVAWRVFDAQYFGVAQRRRRVFVVASAREGFDPTAILFEFDGVRRDSPPSREAGQESTGSLTASSGRRGGVDDPERGTMVPVAFGGNNQSGPIEVATARNASASASGRLDFESETFLVQEVSGTLQAAGKAAGSATQQDAESGLLVPVGPRAPRYACLACELNFDDEHANGVKSLAPAECPQCGDEDDIIDRWMFSVQPALSVALRGRDGGATAELGDEVAGTQRAGGGGGDKAHVLAPIAFDARQDCVSSSELFGALSSSSPQAQAIATFGLSGEINANVDHIGALDAGSKSGGGQPSMVMQPGMAVRRLTPVECLRLQGYEDGYLRDVLHRGKPLADGPMYKMIGNSWAVPNIVWIGKRIRAALDRSAA